MRTIDVGICHDNDRMVTQLRGVVIFFHARAESRDHEAYFLGGKHFVEARFFHVEDFTLERKDRLIAPVAALLGRAAGGIALEDRKSTRLNSSHPSISYAVFCLKKK